MPPSKRRTRFLPCACTDSSVRPSIRSATRSAWARGCGDSAAIRWPTSTCRRRAARWSESPSGTFPKLAGRGLFVQKLSLNPNLNIAALTQRTGVPSDTIRKWEQRYGVLHPERTAGGQRRYSELDVARVEWLKERIHEGYRIGEAAALLGAGDQVARTVDELRTGIVDATIASDVDALGQLVDQALALSTLDESFVQVLTPALVEVGERWASGAVSVAQEHLASSRRTARRGPARKPASTSSGIASVSATGSPSKRSTASRLRAPAGRAATSAASAGRSHASSGSRSGTSERPPRST